MIKYFILSHSKILKIVVIIIGKEGARNLRARFENIAKNTEEEVRKKAEEERKKRLLFEQQEREEQTKLYEVSNFIKFVYLSSPVQFFFELIKLG